MSGSTPSTTAGRSTRSSASGRVGETYHVGTGIERSIEQIADLVLAHLDKPSSLKTIVPDRPGHDRRYVLDWSKIRRELGWEPVVDWETGLAETIDWYATHPSVVGAAPRPSTRRRELGLEDLRCEC